jgi:hypothetical protein
MKGRNVVTYIVVAAVLVIAGFIACAASEPPHCPCCEDCITEDCSTVCDNESVIVNLNTDIDTLETQVTALQTQLNHRDQDLSYCQQELLKLNTDYLWDITFVEAEQKPWLLGVGPDGGSRAVGASGMAIMPNRNWSFHLNYLHTDPDADPSQCVTGNVCNPRVENVNTEDNVVTVGAKYIWGVGKTTKPVVPDPPMDLFASTPGSPSYKNWCASTTTNYKHCMACAHQGGGWFIDFNIENCVEKFCECAPYDDIAGCPCQCDSGCPSCVCTDTPGFNIQTVSN